MPCRYYADITIHADYCYCCFIIDIVTLRHYADVAIDIAIDYYAMHFRKIFFDY